MFLSAIMVSCQHKIGMRKIAATTKKHVDEDCEDILFRDDILCVGSEKTWLVPEHASRDLAIESSLRKYFKI